MGDIKAVIVDIGGVLIKWNDSIVFQYVSKKTGVGIKKIKEASEKYMPLFDTGKITEKEFWKLVSKEIGYKGRLNESWLSHYGRYARKNKPMISLLKECRKLGYKTATITNVIRPHYLYNRKTGLYNIFDKVFASCILKNRKPDEEIYKIAVKKLGLKPEECIFFDDLEENVSTAKKCGMTAYRYISLKKMKKDLKRNGIFVK